MTQHKYYVRIYREYLRSLGESFVEPEYSYTPFGPWRADFYSTLFESYIVLGERSETDTWCTRWFVAHPESLSEKDTSPVFIFVPYDSVTHIGNTMLAKQLANSDGTESPVRHLLKQYSTAIDTPA